MGMLHFDKFEGVGWDIRISGLGIEALVSDIKNTDLKVMWSCRCPSTTPGPGPLP